MIIIGIYILGRDMKAFQRLPEPTYKAHIKLPEEGIKLNTKNIEQIKRLELESERLERETKRLEKDWEKREKEIDVFIENAKKELETISKKIRK